MDDKQNEMEMEELDVSQLDEVAGGRGLRNVEKVETHDIDDDTISKI